MSTEIICTGYNPKRCYALGINNRDTTNLICQLTEDKCSLKKCPLEKTS